MRAACFTLEPYYLAWQTVSPSLYALPPSKCRLLLTEAMLKNHTTWFSFSDGDKVSIQCRSPFELPQFRTSAWILNEFLHLGHFPVSGGDSLPVRMVDTANAYYTRADLRSPDSLSSLCERGGRFRANSSPPRLWLRIPRPGAVVTRWFSLTIWEDRSPYIRTS